MYSFISYIPLARSTSRLPLLSSSKHYVRPFSTAPMRMNIEPYEYQQDSVQYQPQTQKQQRQQPRVPQQQQQQPQQIKFQQQQPQQIKFQQQQPQQIQVQQQPQQIQVQQPQQIQVQQPQQIQVQQPQQIQVQQQPQQMQVPQQQRRQQQENLARNRPASALMNWPTSRLSLVDDFFHDPFFNDPFFNSALTSMNRMLTEMDMLQRSLMANRMFPESEMLKTWSPRWNVRETDSAYEVEVEIPGVKPTDVKVELKDDILTIRGKKVDELNEDYNESEGWIRKEMHRGSFEKSMRLPKNIDRNAITAVNKHGILKVNVKKMEKGPNLVSIPVIEESA